MPLGTIPLIKLVFLAFRQVSRPIANAVKDRAKTSPFFKQHICMPPAQAINALEVRTSMWSKNMPRPLAIPKLSEEAAIDVGSRLIGELFIFTIGSALLVLEYVRQAKNVADKKRADIDERRQMAIALHNANERLDESVVHLEYLDEMIRIIGRRWF